MDSNHKVPVVRITDVLPHPNADRLEIVQVGGYQVVVGKGNFKPGDLAVYVQPDSIVPDIPAFEFVWEKDGGGQLRDVAAARAAGGIPERWRRITVKKLRKEWSEGLLMTLSDLRLLDGVKKSQVDKEDVFEGDDVAEFLGITHYNPPEEQEGEPTVSRKQSKVWPRSLKGWYYFLAYWGSFGLYNPWGDTNGFGNEKAPENTPPMYDVETYKNHTQAFEPTDVVVVTEKIHGSNARYTYRLTSNLNFWGRLKGDAGKMYAGSRKLWKGQASKTIWRQVLKANPEIERWAKDHPGYTLYGEVTPTQSKNDVDYHYGASKEQPKFFAFDIYTPKGEWLNREDFRALTLNYNIEVAPVLYYGVFDLAKVMPLVDGPTTIDTGAAPGFRHIREGVVIKTAEEKHVRGLGRAQLKIVSNAFLEKDGK